MTIIVKNQHAKDYIRHKFMTDYNLSKRLDKFDDVLNATFDGTQSFEDVKELFTARVPERMLPINIIPELAKDKARGLKLNHLGYINNSEYIKGGLIAPIYDIFLEVLGTHTFDSIKSQLDYSAKELLDMQLDEFWKGRTPNPNWGPTEVVDFKLNNYGHGNMHITTCLAMVMNITKQQRYIPTDYHYILRMATTLHDESLAYGYGKETHHLDVEKYILTMKDWEDDDRTEITMTGIVNWENYPSRDGQQMVLDMIRMHRMNVNEVHAFMRNKYFIGKPNIAYPDLLCLGALSLIDKMCMFNPLHARCREWTGRYKEDGINIVIDKIRTKIYDKGENSDATLHTMRYIFGSKNGEYLYKFFKKVAYDDKSPERIAYVDHIKFLQDIERSGYIKAEPQVW